MKSKGLIKKVVCVLTFMLALGFCGAKDVTSAAQPLSNGIYYITTRLDTGYYLSIQSGSTSDNAALITEKKASSTRMQFELTYTSDGYYLITNVNSGKGIQPKNGSTSTYTQVVQYTSSNTDAMKWQLISSGSGYYLLKNKKSNLYLDICNAYASNGNTLQIYPRNDGYYAQDFSFTYVGPSSTPNPDPSTIIYDKMAHNIYLDPNLSSTSGKFDGYFIDFYAEKAPQATYWALCNWSMNNDAFLKANNATAASGEYSNSMGAYGGLQNTAEGKRAIVALWEMYYRDSKGNLKKLVADGKYPTGAGTNFGGEGEGVHYIAKYKWESKKWYRMMFRSWVDKSTKHTYVGAWIQDLETKKWTLFTYFDTKLPDSYMEGDLSLFQENYSTGYWAKRSFRVKNLYALQHGKTTWTSINKATMSYDYPEWGYNTTGTHVFGAKDTYFYGEAGEAVTNQTAYDSSMPKSITKSISQASTLSVRKAKVTSATVTRGTSSAIVKWSLASDYSPQLAYRVIVQNSLGKEIYNKYSTRPEVRKHTINVNVPLGSKVLLTITDVYGGKTTQTIFVR